MMKSLWLITLLAATSFAGPPTTRPVAPTTPVGPRERPTLLDDRRPAFIPGFAKIDRPPAGQFEASDYARRFGQPAGFGYGYGYWGTVGWWGYGFVGGYGAASANVSVNYR